MEALILVIIIAWASRHALNDSKAAASKSRKAYMDRASKRYPHMTSRQASRHAWRHDLGHALSQLLHLFPNARHGFAAGWNEGRQAHVQARAGREKARAEHLEERVRLMPEIRDYVRRQREAQEEIRRQQQGEGSGEGSSPEAPAPATYCGHCGTRGGEQCPPHCASWTRNNPYPGREDAPTYSYGYEGSTAGWPAATVEQAHRQAESWSGDGDPWVVTEYPPGGGPGTTVATYRNGDQVLAPMPDSWHGPDDVASRTPVRCMRHPDRACEWVQYTDGTGEHVAGAEEPDDDPVTGNWERDPHEDDQCAICGTPLTDEPGYVCIRCQEAREHLEGDEQAAAEDHAVQYEPFFGEDNPGQSAPGEGSSPTEGTTMSSDVTFESVTNDMAGEVNQAENRAAEVNAAMVAADAQAQEVADAKTRAATTGEQMQALNMDPATLGAIADHIEALDAAEKAHQHVQEALEAARKEANRAMETAQNVLTTLARQQGQLAEAHANTQQSADNAFFGQ